MKEPFGAQLEGYLVHLQLAEKSPATQRQYRRAILDFIEYLGEKSATKEAVIGYKTRLQKNYLPASVNAKLAALNGFFSFVGRGELRVKQLKIQRQAYCPKERELTEAEYLRLIKTAQRRGEAVVQLKGKTRTVLIAGRMRSALQGYIRRAGIQAGPVFISRSGHPLDRSNIWKMMRALCRGAGVAVKKVFPHNLRHLFARCFYAADKDIAKLADILGHSNINTTRLYIVSTGQEHRRRMDALGLVV